VAVRGADVHEVARGVLHEEVDRAAADAVAEQGQEIRDDRVAALGKVDGAGLLRRSPYEARSGAVSGIGRA
jgi:hypothetical protein